MTSDISPKVVQAVLETIEGCATIAEDDEHGEIGKMIANKIRGISVFRDDELVGNYMLRDGISETEARSIAKTVRDILNVERAP